MLSFSAAEKTASQLLEIARFSAKKPLEELRIAVCGEGAVAMALKEQLSLLFPTQQTTDEPWELVFLVGTAPSDAQSCNVAPGGLLLDATEGVAPGWTTYDVGGKIERIRILPLG